MSSAWENGMSDLEANNSTQNYPGTPYWELRDRIKDLWLNGKSICEIEKILDVKIKIRSQLKDLLADMENGNYKILLRSGDWI